MAPGEQKAKRWGIWQFSFRGLLLLTLLVATFFGGWKASDWHRERELIRAAAEDRQKRDEFFRSLQSGQITEWPTDNPPQEIEIIGDAIRIPGAKSLPKSWRVSQ